MFKKFWERKFSILAFVALMMFFWYAPESIATFIAGMMWGAAIAGGLIFHFFKVQKKMPYTWTCPRDGCHYHIETSGGGELMLLEVAEDHDRQHAMEDD